MASQDLALLNPGSSFVFKSVRWTVLRQIYDGPFSKVFMLQKADDNEHVYAMKVEPKEGCIRPVLKLDVSLLSLLNGKVGFPQLIEAGRVADFKFCMMKFVGPELGVLQSMMPNNRFTPTTAYRVALQTLDRLQTLHDQGWLNRDVKASNFAVGLGAEEGIIYMLDFGLARRYMTENGNNRPLRSCGPCVGTLPFAPLAAASCRDLGPKDDLEGWLYMVVYMILGRLPWYDEKGRSWDHGITREWKTYVKEVGKRELFGSLPPEWLAIYDSINQTRRTERAPYDFVRRLLMNVMVREGYNSLAPFDWQVEPRLMEVMKSAGYKGEFRQEQKNELQAVEETPLIAA